MKALRRYLRLWRYLAARSMAAQLAYRGDFAMGIVRNLGYIALSIIFYNVLFLHTGSIDGWSQPAIIALFGTFRLVKGVLYFFVEENIDAMPELVRGGEMDFVLLKPISARFLLSCSKVNLGAAANAAIGLGLVVYGLRAAPSPGVGAQAAYVGLIVCAVVIFYNLLFSLLTVSFWAGKVEGLQYLFDEILNLAGLPVSVYKGALGAVVSYMIPLGIAATVPAGALSGHPAPFFYVYAPAIALVTSLGSQILWRRAIASYTSAGG